MHTAVGFRRTAEWFSVRTRYDTRSAKYTQSTKLKVDSRKQEDRSWQMKKGLRDRGRGERIGKMDEKVINVCYVHAPIPPEGG